MKHIFTFLALFTALLVSAKEKIGDLYYDLDDSNMTAKVTYLYNNYSNSSYVKGDLIIPESVIFNSKTYTVTSIGNYAFLYCSGLTSVEIPNSVKTICYEAFGGCSGLTSVEIPNSVKSIENYAFDYCSGLTSVVIPNSVTSIGDNAFHECSRLKKSACPDHLKNPFSYGIRISYPAKSSIMEDGVIYDKNKNTIIFASIDLKDDYTIPNTIIEIGWSAFAYCSGLTSIDIPNSVKSIGEYAFGDCKNLEKVEISDLTAWCKIDFRGYGANPTFYSHSLFLNGEEIIDLKIPDSINNIRAYSFMGLKHLKSVEIPNSIISIGTDAFDGCEQLTNIDFPNSLEKISSSAFGQCKSLTSVTFPEFCSYLGAGAFSGCEGLKEINFNNTGDFLDLSSGVFNGCKSIEKIFCNSVFPIFCDYSDVFSDVTYKNAVLYVLKKNIDYYKNYSPWHLFQNLQVLEDYPDVEGVDFILAEGQTVDVYSLNGLLVLRRASQSDLDALRPGIYIIGGKKYVVK